MGVVGGVVLMEMAERMGVRVVFVAVAVTVDARRSRFGMAVEFGRGRPVTIPGPESWSDEKPQDQQDRGKTVCDPRHRPPHG